MNVEQLETEIQRRFDFNFSFYEKKVIQHNQELHKTSAYLAEEARRVERLMDRKRWSN